MVAEPRTFNECLYLVSTRGHTMFLHITQLTVVALSCRSVFLFRRPPLSFTTNIFILPFSRAVWLVSAALIALISFLLYCAFRWEFCEKGDEQQTMNWSDVVLLSLGTVCQQGEYLSLSYICKYFVAILVTHIYLFLFQDQHLKHAVSPGASFPSCYILLLYFCIHLILPALFL